MTINTRYLARVLFALFSLFIALTLSAQEKETYRWPVKLQKEYSKSYPVGSELLTVVNRFGEMKIETWDKNEIKVEARISVGASSNEYANQLLEQVGVEDEKTAGRIRFSTKFAVWSDNTTGGHEIRVDYTVHVPAAAKLYAENNYGPLTIGDYSGEAEFVSKYGTFTAGKLSNATLSVDYGKTKITELNDSRIKARYSKVDIDKLSGNITGNFDYCSSIDMPIDNALKELDLKNIYTGLYLMTPKDFSARYDITTINARVTAKNEMTIREETTAANNKPYAFTSNHKYAGTLGNGGGTNILIKSSYGNIRVL